MGTKRPARRVAAPKRAAKKAAVRTPSPLPPAESSDETRSTSRSRSDHSEDEEATADSPVPASTPIPTLKKTTAPSRKGGESEEPVRAPPRNQPPPPQNKEDSDASGSDEEDEDEEEEPARAAAPSPSALKKQPAQPQSKEDSDTSGGEEEEEEKEEEEEEAPPKTAPKKEAEASKPPAAAAETKKPGAVPRIWSTDDEIRILQALAAHRKEHGALPKQDALVDLFAGKLDNASYSSKELDSKVRSLRTRYLTLGKRVDLPSKEHDRQLLDLAKMVWDSDDTTPVAAAAAAAAVAANGHERKGFQEMCKLYPYVAEEVNELEAEHPGMCKREFGKMDDDKARAMDEKIKKQRVAQIRLEMRRSDLVKEVTKALLDLVHG